jgi:hypothetical protein
VGQINLVDEVLGISTMITLAAKEVDQSDDAESVSEESFVIIATRPLVDLKMILTCFKKLLIISKTANDPKSLKETGVFAGLEPVTGIEPVLLVYKTSALPLDDTGIIGAETGNRTPVAFLRGKLTTTVIGMVPGRGVEPQTGM